MVELLTVLAFVSEVVSSGLVGFLVVFGRAFVDRVEEGVLKIMGGVIIGFDVVNNCLIIVVCVVIPGLGVLNLFRLIWLNVVGLILFTSCPNK